MVRPLDQARAAMMPSPVGQDTGWFRDGKLRYRRDGMAKVTGSKVFALDLRARDLDGWPDQQSHALLIMIPRADAVFEGLDLSVLGDGLQPDVLVDYARLSDDGRTDRTVDLVLGAKFETVNEDYTEPEAVPEVKEGGRIGCE